MAILKCKMCGGTLDVSSNKGIATCEYCGTQQTLPRTQNDKVRSLHERANDLRRQNEFDKAKAIYEQILAEDNEDAETYWALVLCDYGIEYVEEPSTGKRVPTVHRAHYTSIYTDNNFKMAMQYADDEQKDIYNSEAKKIEKIQKGILDISSKEEPFDVFICYKETDANGERTEDSVIATDLYHRLTNQGYKVFFSRITLEDKLGTAYEPYIFAALNSAKVMVVLGTKPEYFEAVWVRNEWSRFLELSKKEGNRTLIPAYKGMNPYDLPKEFSYLQAQDMSKIGFLQDLIAGIDKLLKDSKPAETPAVSPATTVSTAENKAGKSMPKKNVIIIAAIVAVVIAVVAIVVVLGLNKSEPPSTQNPDSSEAITDQTSTKSNKTQLYTEEETLAIYGEVINQYKASIRNGFDYNEFGSYVNPEMLGNAQYFDSFKVYYALTDINKDGISELVIGATDNYAASGIGNYDIFTHDGNSAVPLFEIGLFGYRVNFSLFNNGVIWIHGGTGANSCSYHYYKIPENATYVEHIKGVAYDDYDGYVRYYTTDVNSNEISQITQTDFESEVNKNTSSEINLEWIEIVA